MFKSRIFRSLNVRRYTTHSLKSDSNVIKTAAKEEPKENLKEKWLKYWKNLYIDYREVGKDALTDIKERPVKNSILFSVFAGLTYCAKTNPDEQSFHDSFIQYNNDLILLLHSWQNPKTAEHFKFIENCNNSGQLRRISLGFFSVMWLADYDDACKLYKCTCTYLKPQYSTYFDRIVDVGFINKWWILEEKYRDYDINDV